MNPIPGTDAALSFTPIAGTEGLPAWAQILAVVAMAVATALFHQIIKGRGASAEQKKQIDGAHAAGMAGSMVAAAPTADRMAFDAIAATLGTMDMKLTHLTSVVQEIESMVKEERKERAREERDEMKDDIRSLQRMIEDLDPTGARRRR